MGKDDLTNSINNADETIVIADECGDSMWDAVLQQEIKVRDDKLNLMTGSEEAMHVGNEIKV